LDRTLLSSSSLCSAVQSMSDSNWWELSLSSSSSQLRATLGFWSCPKNRRIMRNPIAHVSPAKSHPRPPRALFELLLFPLYHPTVVAFGCLAACPVSKCSSIAPAAATLSSCAFVHRRIRLSVSPHQRTDKCSPARGGQETNSGATRHPSRDTCAFAVGCLTSPLRSSTTWPSDLSSISVKHALQEVLPQHRAHQSRHRHISALGARVLVARGSVPTAMRDDIVAAVASSGPRACCPRPRPSMNVANCGVCSGCLDCR
jgi:hypothetical protein